MRRTAPMLAGLALIAGCVIPGPSSVHVGDSQEQVRTKLGAPAVERKLGDTNRAWYYVTGPEGFETWRVVFGPGGQVSEYAQVLTAKNFVAMREGATREEVLDRVGPPKESMIFARTGTEALTYRWRDGTLEMLADVVLDTTKASVKNVSLYRDPAYSSPPSTNR